MAIGRERFQTDVPRACPCAPSTGASATRRADRKSPTKRRVAIADARRDRLAARINHPQRRLKALPSATCRAVANRVVAVRRHIASRSGSLTAFWYWRDSGRWTARTRIRVERRALFHPRLERQASPRYRGLGRRAPAVCSCQRASSQHLFVSSPWLDLRVRTRNETPPAFAALVVRSLSIASRAPSARRQHRRRCGACESPVQDAVSAFVDLQQTVTARGLRRRRSRDSAPVCPPPVSCWPSSAVMPVDFLPAQAFASLMFFGIGCVRARTVGHVDGGVALAVERVT